MSNFGVLLTESVKDIIDSGSSLEDSALNPLGSKVSEFGGGTYHLLIKISAYVVVIGLMVAGLKLIFSNVQNRNEAKGNIVSIVIGGVLIFGAVAIAALIQTIGGGLFNLS